MANNGYSQSSIFDTVFSTLPEGPGPHTLTAVQVNILLQSAVDQGWNIFDLLNEGIPYLISKNIRIRILGNDLRASSLIYRLGDTRVDAVLPLAKIQELQIGKTLTSGQGAADVILTQTHSQYLEIGEFYLETRYGFRTIRGKSLADAYGIKVKSGILTFDMSHIERVPDPTGGINPNFIAIHVHFFFRPKRWHIDPIHKL